MSGVTTIETDGFRIDGTGQGAAEMMKATWGDKAIKPEGPPPDAPRPPMDGGEEEKAVETPKEARPRDEKGKFTGKAAETPKADSGEPETTPDSSDTKETKEAKADAVEGGEGKPTDAPAQSKKDKRGDPRHDPRARVEQATSQAAEYRRRYEETQAQLNEVLSRLLQASQQGAPQGNPAGFQGGTERDNDPGVPKKEDFADYESFVDARAAYRAERAAEARFKALMQETQRAHAEAAEHQAKSATYTGFQQKIEKAGGKDFLDSLDERVVNTRPISAYSREEIRFLADNGGIAELARAEAAEHILRSDHAAELLKHFSENPDDFQRLPTLHPRELARAIGRIEARFEQAVRTVPAARVEVSKAEAPVSTVTGTARSSATEPDATADYDVWAAARKAKMRRG